MQYIFWTQRRLLGDDWALEDPAYHGFEEPKTKQRAMAFYEELRRQGNVHVRVVRLSDDGTWADVSGAIEEAICEAARDEESDAAADRAHERQERHGWEMV